MKNNLKNSQPPAKSFFRLKRVPISTSLTQSTLVCFNCPVMSKICEFCGKTYQQGNLVPRGIGNRVTRRTLTKKKANLRVKRLELNGRKVKVTICASCLKRLKKDVREAALEASTATAQA